MSAKRKTITSEEGQKQNQKQAKKSTKETKTKKANKEKKEKTQDVKTALLFGTMDGDDQLWHVPVNPETKSILAKLNKTGCPDETTAPYVVRSEETNFKTKWDDYLISPTKPTNLDYPVLVFEAQGPCEFLAITLEY
jgi:hypothetical protein